MDAPEAVVADMLRHILLVNSLPAGRTSTPPANMFGVGLYQDIAPKDRAVHDTPAPPDLYTFLSYAYLVSAEPVYDIPASISWSPDSYRDECR
jgi:hypothetical protein